MTNSTNPKIAPIPAAPLASITTAIIHHSACCNPSTDKTPAQIANYHVYTHKWPGIGYHFLIDEEGKAYQTNWLSHISYHAQQTNPYSLGICLLGNFTQLTPTNPQLTTTSKLLLKLRKSLPNLHQTKPHNHVVPSTACPGATSNQWLGEITLQSDPASQPPPKTAGKNYDLLPYLRGNTETLYELTHHAKDGQQSTHRVQTQRNGDKEWFITKGNEHHAEFEHLFLMNNNRQIGRGADTSMGILNGRRRAYTIFQNGRYGAPWINRHMVIGESFFGDNHEVRAFYIDDCSYSALNSGTARNHTTLKNIYPTHTLPNGKIIEDVAHIYNVVNGRPSEHYFFAKNIGLIQWENERGDKSYLGEIHAPGARPFNNREPMPPCATVY